MGHRMKNYGLAAGPTSTMHLSVSEESKPQPTQLKGERNAARLRLHENVLPVFNKALKSSLLYVYYKVTLLKHHE